MYVVAQSHKHRVSKQTQKMFFNKYTTAHLHLTEHQRGSCYHPLLIGAAVGTREPYNFISTIVAYNAFPYVTCLSFIVKQ